MGADNEHCAEQLCALLAPRCTPEDAECVFVLGAPRTGSTFLYQALIAGFRLPYLANLTNDFWPEQPIVGLALQAGLAGREVIGYDSAFGKVPGLLSPSEGSHVMRHWFGGGHPSQLVSTSALPGREHELVRTLAAARALFGRPLVIKNAWNCFRIGWLASALPRATFIWIKRDIAAAACSDLAARYAVQGDPHAWNSATPANVEQLRALPPAGQVVENQYEFALAIGTALATLPASRHATIQYEHLCASPAATLGGLADRLPTLGRFVPPANFAQAAGSRDRMRVSEAESEEIASYVASDCRLQALRCVSTVSP